MDSKEIIQQIKNKIYHPVYLLHGEEPYFIDLISDYISENVLEAHEKDFNQTIAYGRDVKPEEIFALAKGFPMMANNQVVIVREAQDIKPPEKVFEMLTDYLENPQKSTLLVFCYKYKKLDGRKKAIKTAQNVGIVFESPKVWDSQVPGLIKTFVKDAGYRIGDKSTMMMTEFIGANLMRMNSELEKLYMFTKKGDEITPEIIEKNIGISKDFNVFELYKSLGTKKHDVTFKIIHYFGENSKENPPQKIIPMLFSFFNKIMVVHNTGVSPNRNSYGNKEDEYIAGARNYSIPKLIKIFDILREFDLKSKGVNSDKVSDDQLLMEMIIKVAYVQ